MTTIGTPLSDGATRVIVLGSGELGKEVVIELQRLGVETIAVDRYSNAPAMQVAHRNHTINMLDASELTSVVETEQPHLIVPEIEAIATSALMELEARGFRVIPSANAAHLTMNREGIRTLAAKDLKVPVSDYRFADSVQSFFDAVEQIGIPCVVKPTMSSSGKGQSVVKSLDDALDSWKCAQEGTRGAAEKVIVEQMIDFDYEITLLTVQHVNGVAFCEPIGHRQVGGDYQESWQPHPMDTEVLDECKRIAERVTGALGGRGIYGVEFFIKGVQVYFSELSPRPHDTGMVTLISQDMSEFALHARAILDLPVPNIELYGPSASAVLIVEGESESVRFRGLEDALTESGVQIRLFGKPSVSGERRMGVALARGTSIDDARNRAQTAANKIRFEL
ncbi:MAG: formate-dependent phosphoribosylglycinamide formyltransferase [Gammaproteobacteria bacterium]|nr:formate-dependent phosphoribosylglycinamide formyltransferase [Gammaproteobacteria bacterium]